MRTLFSSQKLLAWLPLAALLLLFVAAGCGDPPKPPPECEKNADCPDGKMCSAGKCVPKPKAPPRPECTTDADCPDPKICVNNKCKYECQQDSDCRADEECVNYRCQPKPQCDVEQVHFPFDQYYLTNEAQATLRANAECIKKKSLTDITIEGHCDERGSSEYNLSLGQKRAQSVRDFLVDLGVAPSKIRVISYGEERPIDPASNEEAWAKNRRAETVSE